ncbi:hypothetical protein [Robertkochia aurantiaca]|uniref:hypothetical protein n=1 Tax=Robertkochia aurantiaca TaxID=2873700 RepID=UPI001CC953CD
MFLTCLQLFLLLGWQSLYAQEGTEIRTRIDTTAIRIGEQVRLELEVLTDSTDLVEFPEGQTFLPMEMVESFKTDTTVLSDRMKLLKAYSLTQFDSGTYALPSQMILVNGKPVYSDSLNIYVNNVAVDTTKQKLYEIKDFVPVERNYAFLWPYIIAGVLLLSLIAFLVWWFFYRKSLLTEEEQIAALPPYEKALIELKKLDESRYLIQSNYKGYYTDLTNIIRSYLEDDVHISALESTTDELIFKLEMLRDGGNLDLDRDSIEQFKKVLQTADLVKFAKQVPDNQVISRDRGVVEDLVKKTKAALPEPTEEEMMQDAAYLAELKKERKSKRVKRFALAAAGVVVVLFAASIAIFGFSNVRDTLFGNELKSMLRSEWVASEYGYPAIYAETPEVLRRVDTKVDQGEKEGVNTRQVFALGSPEEGFYLRMSSSTYNTKEAFDINKEVESTIALLEEAGATNMIVKDDKFTTPSGAESTKVFGVFQLEDSDYDKNMAYEILNFVEHGGYQQILLVYPENDRYAPEIVSRILGSLEFKIAGNV